jgi:endonuclease/exonuclease/phosphatase (EEP) superfamily protein YafD
MRRSVTGRRFLTAGAAAFTAIAAAATLAAPAGAGAGRATADVAQTSDITMIQANIYTGLSPERFQADVREVLAVQPDFVTYNEVPFRNDEVMAPEGYAIHRNMRDRFTAATPVAWREDRWTAIDQGVWRISNWRGKPPGRVVELGRRFANWVTLQDVDGRVVSVVSIHIAPVVRGMPDLLRRSVTRLDALVAELESTGPVLVGGDFNVHYRSSRYPRDILSRNDLVATYDNLASYFATGDHHGYTIDYVMGTGSDVLAPVDHYPIELKSDHDAVVAGLSWTVDAPADTTVVSNDPTGDRAERRAALISILDGIKAAQPGAQVALATNRLDLPAVVRQVGRALERGVHLQVVTTSKEPSSVEQRLSRRIAASGDSGSSMRWCTDTCRGVWNDAGLPRALMMLSDASGRWTTRYDASRQLGPELVTQASRVRVSVGPHALEDGQQLLASIG